jgi:hypothetical protein
MVFQPQDRSDAPVCAVDMEISRDEFQAVAQLVESNFGIHLTEGKRAMMGSRLVKAVRHAGFRSFVEFY